MTTPFAALGARHMTKTAAEYVDVEVLPPLPVTAFAMMDPMCKEAGWGQDMLDGAWNATMKPMGQAISKGIGGIGGVAGAGAKNVWQGLSAVPRAGMAALKGGIQGVQQGGLGGFAQGAIDGGWNSYAQTGKNLLNNTKQGWQGIGNAATGIGEAAGRSMTLPFASAYGAGKGLGQGIRTSFDNAVNSAVDQRMAGQGGGGATPPASGPGIPAEWATPRDGQQPGADPNNPTKPVSQFDQLAGGMQQAPQNIPVSTSGGAATGGVSGAPPIGGANYDPFQDPNNNVKDWRSQFQNKTGTPYNPGSPMDRGNMKFIQSGQSPLSYNQWMNKGASAFAALDEGLRKEAGTVGLAQKALRGASGLVGKSPRLSGLAGKAEGAASKMDDLGDVSRKAINIGAPTAAIGGSLFGANRMGHSSGRKAGLGEGYDVGSQAGLQAALASQPGDPGFIGRLLNVFKGNPEGPDAAALQNMLDRSKEDIIGTILRGTA